MIINNFKRKHIIWFHVIFWLVEIFIGYSYYIFSPDKIPSSYYFARLLSTIAWMSAFYIAYAIIVPFVSLKRKTGLKVVTVILIYAVFIVLDAFYIKFFNVNVFKAEQLKLSRYVLNAFTYTSSYMIMGVIFRIAVNGIKATIQKESLAKQNLKSELALLRSQINPHFLFNTLNNIHSLAHTDVDKTAFSVIKLSEIMRYMLGEANTEKVLLEDEINYIKSYIALQNIRFSENDYVEFNIEGNIINKFIAPMILVPFIENAFKHGDKRQKAPGIKVSLIVSESEINFKVTNLKKKIKTVDIEEKSGFGLENLKRRLELTYPNKFELDIDDSGNEYITSLKIELSDED